MNMINGKLAVGMLCLSAAAAVNADPNVYAGGNLWSITAYDDSSIVHTQWATQGICFLPPVMTGTHLRGNWYSTTFPDWNGVYSQEGDQVFMHGDYAKDVGHDGIDFEVITNSPRNLAGGHWFEWRENGGFGNTIGFANTKLERIGYCKVIQPADLVNLYVAPRFLVDGRIAQQPGEANQIPLNDLGAIELLK
ncbi:MAG: hypothetical protein HY273_12475 [Gammaproteobacteria bacterium]|nr:hypothetical protein [Gammaproteobacteria bacterium]